MGLQALLNHASRSPAGALAVTLLLILGAIGALKALARLASGVYTYFLRPGKDLRRLGQWAVMTGATDGIGKAYAAALAKKGAGRSPARSLARGGGAEAGRGERRGSVRSWELGSFAPPASRSCRARAHSRRLPRSLAEGISAAEVAQWSRRIPVTRAGLNVLLVSRTQAKLDEVAAELAGKYRVQTETAALDFGAADAAAWARVKAQARPAAPPGLQAGGRGPHRACAAALQQPAARSLRLPSLRLAGVAYRAARGRGAGRRARGGDPRQQRGHVVPARRVL